MNKSEQINEISLALGQAQGEFPEIPKDKLVTVRSDKGNYSYKYADLATIIKAVKPVLARHGLSVSQVAETTKDGGKLTTMLLHASGQYISGEFEFAETGRMQQTGSSITYVRRYALSAILGIATDDGDDDANAADGIKPVIKSLVKPQKPHPGDGDQTSDPLKIQIGKYAGKHVTEIPAEELIEYYENLMLRVGSNSSKKPGKPGEWEQFVQTVGSFVETLKQIDPEEGYR